MASNEPEKQGRKPYLMPAEEVSRYGFRWPVYREDTVGHVERDDVAELQVTRIATSQIHGGHQRILGIRTPKADLEIYVSRTGHVRVFDRRRAGWPELRPKEAIR